MEERWWTGKSILLSGWQVLDQGYVDDSEAESAVVFSKNIR